MRFSKEADSPEETMVMIGNSVSALCSLHWLVRGIKDTSMNKIRLSLSSKSEDFARLYNPLKGFYGAEATLQFPASDSFYLFFSTRRKYTLEVTGDAELLESPCRNKHVQFFSVSWSQKSRNISNGEAVLTIQNPEYPDQPTIFRLSLGVFSFEYNTPDNQPKDSAASAETISEMLMDACTSQNSGLSYFGKD